MTDLGERIPLEPLDPGFRDPGFWVRFHTRVMRLAEGELGRRRMTNEVSVVEVMFAWRKALVPMTLMAAALAGLLLVQEDPESSLSPVPVEEVLIGGLDGDPIPVVLAAETDLFESAILVSGEGF
jgi:hypothetical protein